MGYIRHNAIVVTSWDEARLAEVARHAEVLELDVLGPSRGTTNGYRTLLVCPDGSKEGWDGSEAGDKKRAAFCEFLRTQVYEDGSSWLEWAEVVYGADDEEAAVVDDAWRS